MEITLKITEKDSKSPHLFVDVFVDGQPMKDGGDVAPPMYFNRGAFKSKAPDIRPIVDAFIRNVLAENSAKTFAEQKTTIDALKIKVQL